MLLVRRASLEYLPRFRADVEGTFMELVHSVPELADLVSGGKREEHFRGLADVPNFHRQSFGPGWALVGDAGYDKDPVTAQGISDAFCDADALADAIDDGLSGREEMDQALARYQQARDERTAAMYEWTLVSTRFVPDKGSTNELMQQIADDPELSQMFINLNPGLADYRTMLTLAWRGPRRQPEDKLSFPTLEEATS
jgi:2-polyprenyl-6-methoxyphenol hydroxylase-like FAD-dependent oxidoreductase